MRLRETRSERLVKGLERAVARDLRGPSRFLRAEPGWLLKRHRDYLRAISIEVEQGGPVRITLEPNERFEERHRISISGSKR